MLPIQKMPRKPHVPFTLERKEQYLALFRSDPECGGRKYLCAERVGVSYTTVDDHLKRDPEFAIAFEGARQAWIDENLIGPALERAIKGTKKPLIGGQFRDQVVAHERVYSDSLMSMMLRAHRPEFKDKDVALAQVGSAGVLIVPGAPETISEWQKQFGELAKGHLDAGPKGEEK